MDTLGAPAPALSAAHKSQWHSPVPYVFGGLAAMLGLIAFALLILSCTFWNLAGESENPSDGERDLEAGVAHGGAKVAPPVFEEKYLVIMAGQDKPTFLATPVSSRASSFGSKRTISSENSEYCQEKKVASSVQIH